MVSVGCGIRGSLAFLMELVRIGLMPPFEPLNNVISLWKISPAYFDAKIQVFNIILF